jgi:hypothetical protein
LQRFAALFIHSHRRGGIEIGNGQRVRRRNCLHDDDLRLLRRLLGRGTAFALSSGPDVL